MGYRPYCCDETTTPRRRHTSAPPFVHSFHSSCDGQTFTTAPPAVWQNAKNAECKVCSDLAASLWEALDYSFDFVGRISNNLPTCGVVPKRNLMRYEFKPFRPFHPMPHRPCDYRMEDRTRT
jgi:hypothetical protein